MALILPKIKYLLKKEIQNFINQQLDKPAADLLFMAKKYPDWDMVEIAQQVEGKQKAKNKIPSWFKRENILYPLRLSMEQCSSEQTAKYKASICHSNRFIDLTGGFGVDTYFISQSFEKSVHCELNERLQTIAQHNFNTLGKKIDSFHKDGITYLKNCEEIFDLIYIDPARRNENNKKVIQLSDYNPNILENLNLLFQKGKQILVKVAPLLDIKQVLNELPHVKEVHVVSLKNECKEVLYLLDKGYNGEAELHCVNIDKSKYNFTYSKEENSAPLSKPLSFLYEPNASILKAGGFNSIAHDFNLQKLHPNTHLYTTKNLITDFPGRIFKIDAICKYKKKDLLKHLPNKKANITRRNFPVSVAEIRKKTGIKEGGEYYLFATTLKDKPKFLVCSKI